MKGKLGLVILLLSPLLYAIILPSTVANSYGMISYQDLDQDGDPDLAIVVEETEPPSEVIPRITAEVYDQDDDMVETYDWRTSCDLDTDAWFFSRYSPEMAGYNVLRDIAVIFKKEGSKLVASVYDDVDGDGRVSFSSLGDGRVEITESSFPRVVVKAEDWDKGDIILYYDGGINMEPSWPGWSGIELPLDGVFDYRITYYDQDKDGDFDLDYYEILTLDRVDKLLEGDIIPKYFVRDAYDDAEIIGHHAFWRFLGLSRITTDIDSVIVVDWTMGKIVRINPIIAIHYGMEGNIFSNLLYNTEFNVSQWWENPFAFYDLAEDRDDIPELSLRLVDEPEEYGLTPKGIYDNFRYSWDLENVVTDREVLHWSHGIFGWGSNPYNYTNTYLFEAVNHMPFEEARNFIFAQSWDAILFTEDVVGHHRALEGVYENPELAASLWTYRNDYRVVPYFPWVWDRAEWNYHFSDPIRLYISNLDKKLHLLNAKKGVWLISGNESIEYKSSNGKYLDTIIHYRVTFDGEEIEEKYQTRLRMNMSTVDTYKHVEIIESLFYCPGVIVYSNSSGTEIKQISIDPVIKEFSPPKTHEDWVKLKVELEEYGSSSRNLWNVLSDLRSDWLFLKVQLDKYNVSQSVRQQFSQFNSIDWLSVDLKRVYAQLKSIDWLMLEVAIEEIGSLYSDIKDAFDQLKSDWSSLEVEFEKYMNSQNLKLLFDQFNADEKLIIEKGTVITSLWNDDGWAIALDLGEDSRIIFQGFGGKVYVDEKEISGELVLPKGKYVLSDHVANTLKKEMVKINSFTESEKLDLKPFAFIPLIIFFVLSSVYYLRTHNKVLFYEIITIILISSTITLFLGFPPSEHYTELYSTSPINLPLAISSNKRIDFTVINHEGRQVTYDYRISFLFYSNGVLLNEETVFNDTITLKNKESSNIVMSIPPALQLRFVTKALEENEGIIKSESRNSVKVSIQLFTQGSKEPYREIYYWLNEY